MVARGARPRTAAKSFQERMMGAEGTPPGRAKGREAQDDRSN